MKIYLRYPYPKSFPSGEGLTIASLKNLVNKVLTKGLLELSLGVKEVIYSL